MHRTIVTCQRDTHNHLMFSSCSRPSAATNPVSRALIISIISPPQRAATRCSGRTETERTEAQTYTRSRGRAAHGHITSLIACAHIAGRVGVHAGRTTSHSASERLSMLRPTAQCPGPRARNKPPAPARRGTGEHRPLLTRPRGRRAACAWSARGTAGTCQSFATRKRTARAREVGLAKRRQMRRGSTAVRTLRRRAWCATCTTRPRSRGTCTCARMAPSLWSRSGPSR